MEILFSLFPLTNVLIVSRFGYKRLLNAVNVNVFPRGTCAPEPLCRVACVTAQGKRQEERIRRRDGIVRLGASWAQGGTARLKGFTPVDDTLTWRLLLGATDEK